MEFNAKSGMDIAFASIFVLAIGLTIANDTVTGLTTTSVVNGTADITGIAATVLSYVPLVIGAGFLYMIAKMTGVL